MRCLVLESRPLARAHITRAIARHAAAHIGIATASEVDICRAVGSGSADVLFLDADHPALDRVLLTLREQGATAPALVMMSDFPERAIGAFDHGASDFLLRPIDPGRLSVAVRRLQQVIKDRSDSSRAVLLEEALVDLRQRVGCESALEGGRDFWVSGHGARVRIGQSEIVWLEAARGYVYFHLRNRKLLERMTMKQLEQRLDTSRFLRIHRSAIVNVDEIAAALRDRHGLYAVELTSGAQVRVGRKYRESLSAFMRATQASPRPEHEAA